MKYLLEIEINSRAPYFNIIDLLNNILFLSHGYIKYTRMRLEGKVLMQIMS